MYEKNRKINKWKNLWRHEFEPCTTWTSQKIKQKLRTRRDSKWGSHASTLQPFTTRARVGLWLFCEKVPHISSHRNTKMQVRHSLYAGPVRQNNRRVLAHAWPHRPGPPAQQPCDGPSPMENNPPLQKIEVHRGLESATWRKGVGLLYHWATSKVMCHYRSLFTYPSIASRKVEKIACEDGIRTHYLTHQEHICYHWDTSWVVVNWG
jgi:hypothetical protein